jgi:outer membrane protein assembly factor BamB
VLTDAGVFIGSSNGGLYLLDEDSGEVEWTFEPGYRLSGVSAEIAVDGRQMVVVTNAGRILSLVVPQDSNDEQ